MISNMDVNPKTHFDLRHIKMRKWSFNQETILIISLEELSGETMILIGILAKALAL